MKILLIVDPERRDWFEYLKRAGNHDYLLLWHEKAADVPEALWEDPFFKKVYYWEEFRTPIILLKTIKPDRIIFFEIIDQRQIALLVVANASSIKTFYLEHGAAGDRETAIRRGNEKAFFRKKKLQYIAGRIKRGLSSLFKSKFFYFSAIFHLRSLGSSLKFVRLPFVMLSNTPNKALARIIFPERIPGLSIVFNRPNFEQYQVYTGITENQAVFTGVPIFDSYFNRNTSEGDHLSFIDHPYLEQRLFGWSPEFHRMLANTLYEFAKSRKTRILVKLHPTSNLKLWESYGFDPAYIDVVQAGDYSKELLSSKLILAYSSSMVNGFLCARKNIVLLGWHPVPGIIGVDFSRTGLCHLSLSPADLGEKMDWWLSNNLSVKNEEAYLQYLERFNYPFDGQASNRVIKVITGNEAP